MDVLVLDAGVLRPPAFPPDVPREEVFAAAGESLDALRTAGDRGRAVEAAARGAAASPATCTAGAAWTACSASGGSAGTAIGTAAMRALPFGVPKLMVSTMASGQVRPYVGQSDVCMMYSVVDLSGLNRVSRRVLANAAAAMAGMVRRATRAGGRRRRPAADRRHDVRRDDAVRGRGPCSCVEQAGYETLVFHATGTGGRTMETFIAEGQIAGVLDLTTTELADELVGGVLERRAATG